jgi:hypothetical protein
VGRVTILGKPILRRRGRGRGRGNLDPSWMPTERQNEIECGGGALGSRRYRNCRPVGEPVRRCKPTSRLNTVYHIVRTPSHSKPISNKSWRPPRCPGPRPSYAPSQLSTYGGIRYRSLHSLIGTVEDGVPETCLHWGCSQPASQPASSVYHHLALKA